MTVTGRRSAAAGQAGFRPTAVRRRGRPDAGGDGRRVRRPGRRAQPPLAARPARGAGDDHRRPGSAASGAGQSAGQRPHAHPRRDDGVVRSADRAGTIGDHGDRQRAGHPRRSAAGDLQPVRPRRLARGPGPPGRPGWAWPSWRRWSAPTAVRVGISSPGRTTFTVRLPGAGLAGGQPGGAAATGGWSSRSCSTVGVLQLPSRR